MPHGARHALVGLTLCLALATPAARAQSGAWTDPPDRKPAAEAPQTESPPQAKVPAQARSSQKPEAASAAPPRRTETPARISGTAEADRPARNARRVAPPRAREAAARRHAGPARASRPAIRTARADAPREAARPVHPPYAVGRFAPYPHAVRYGYRVYGYGPGYADDRLERLSAAEAAGYLVVRRRSVEFPDGRSLRVYRSEEDEID